MKITFCVMLFFSLQFPAFAQPVFKAVYFDNFPPYSWKENGQMHGILIDILNESINKRMGIPISHEGYPWKRAQLIVKSEKADAFVTIPTSQRREFTRVSKEAVVNSKVTLFVKAEHPKLRLFHSVKTVEELRQFKLIGYIGDGVSEIWSRGWDNVNWVPRIDQVLKMIAYERAEIFVQTSAVARYKIKQLGLEGKVIEIPTVLLNLDYHLCIRKTSPFIENLPNFDIIIKQLQKNGTLEAIYQNYK